jgi:hypothetical protein
MAKKETASPFAIDEMALDKEWLGQADLYYSYASQLAEARLALDEAKREADVVEADLSLQIREDPEQFDCPKVTESAIKEVVKLQEEFQDSRGICQRRPAQGKPFAGCGYSIRSPQTSIGETCRLARHQLFLRTSREKRWRKGVHRTAKEESSPTPIRQ